ncbi:MAG: enoyl-CoA hydratase/isomerase family protein [Novosphingobium sp.]
MSGAEQCVLVERDGPLAMIVLNRPDRRNAVTVEMCHGVYEAAREVAASDARVVILRGAGDDFSVGADLAGGGGDGHSPPTYEDLGMLHHAGTLLHTMPQVSIAAIDGGCAGAAFGWAAACDFRFATPEARLNTAILAVGVPGDMGMGWTLTRMLGGARARELMFLPGKITGQEALDIGLVTRLFPRESFHGEVRALADQLCAREPFALRMMKANLVSAEELSLAEFVNVESARSLHCTNRPDFSAKMAEAYRRSKGT